MLRRGEHQRRWRTRPVLNNLWERTSKTISSASYIKWTRRTNIMGRRNKSKQNQDEEGRRGEEEKSKKTWHVHSAQHKKRSIVMAFVRPCGLLVPGTPPRPKGQRKRERKKITIAPRWMCVLDERKPNRWRAINGKERRKKHLFSFSAGFIFMGYELVYVYTTTKTYSYLIRLFFL